jgi:hypothetical protein
MQRGVGTSAKLVCGLRLKAVIDRERVEADPRPHIGDYTLVNLSLRRKNTGGMLDVALTVRNLFDVDASRTEHFGHIDSK